jgi:hypothetical protein
MTNNSVYKLSKEDLVSLKAKETSSPCVVKKGQLVEIEHSGDIFTGVVILTDKDAVMLLTNNKIRWFSRYLKYNILS